MGKNRKNIKKLLTIPKTNKMKKNLARLLASSLVAALLVLDTEGPVLYAQGIYYSNNYSVTPSNDETTDEKTGEAAGETTDEAAGETVDETTGETVDEATVETTDETTDIGNTDSSSEKNENDSNADPTDDSTHEDATSEDTAIDDEPALIGDAGVGTATNLAWKAGSTATATWSTVSGATYYKVSVKVVSNGQTLIEDAQTGTADTEVDLQQQINNARMFMAGGGTVQVSFKVQAVILGINGAEDILGDWSGYSAALDYSLSEVVELVSPTDLILTLDNGRYIAKWTKVEHASAYELYIHIDGEEYFWEHIESYNQDCPKDVVVAVDEQKREASCDVTEAIREICLANKLNGKNVQAAASISPRVDIHGDTSNPDLIYFCNATKTSNVSNSLSYRTDETLLPDAQNQTLEYDSVNKRIIVSWDAMPGVDIYQVWFSVNGQKENYNLWSGPAVTAGQNETDGRVSVDATTEFLNYYYLRGYNGQLIKTSFCVEGHCKGFGQDGYNYNECNTWSNEIEFQYEGEKLKQPTNPKVTVNSGKYILSWDNYDNRAGLYSITMNYYDGNILVQGMGAYLGAITVNGDSASSDLEDRINNVYRVYPNPITVVLTLQAADYADSEYQWSDPTTVPAFIYNPAGVPVVENIKLSPNFMSVPVGKSYTIGKTITPENAMYIDSRWESSDTNIASVMETGAVTGQAPGKATITNSVALASDTATIVVYDVSTNATDDNTAAAITETTENIIDEITNTENADITDNTNAEASQTEQIKEEIHDALDDGDVIHTDISVEETEMSANNTANNVYFAAKAATKTDIIGSGTIRATIYHKKGQEDYPITNITELVREINVVLPVSETVKKDLFANADAISLKRVEKKTDETVSYTDMAYTVNADGTVTVSTKQLSEYVWVKTVDEKDEGAGDSDNGKTDSDKTKIGFKNKNLYLNVGDKKSSGFQYTGTKKVTYKTSNKKIVTVDKKGKVTAKKTGSAKITAKVNNKSYTLKVTVYNPTITGKSSVKKGKTITLKVSGGRGNTTWKSSNKKIATVSKSGKVKGIKKGKVTISATNNGKTIKKKITVK